jgi:tetratricopeptide (TPR) repeat protein
MAPEQRTGGQTVDARADLYSLGATLYHLLVGHPPCRGDGPLAYLEGGDEHAAIEWPRDVTPRLPHWLCNVVDRCLAGQPEQRYGSADELAAELNERIEPAHGIAPPAAPPSGTPSAIVVLPFENLSRDAADDWIGHALADEIHHALRGAGRVQTIDRHEVLHLLGRAYVENGGVPSDGQVLEAAGRLGAGIVIRGNFQHVDDRTKVTVLRFDGVDPGGRVLARVVEASDDVFGLQAVVAEQVIEALGYAARPPNKPEDRPRLGREVRKLYTAAHRAFAAGQYEQSVGHCRAGLEKAPASVELLSLMGVTLARLAAYDEAVVCHRRLEKIARDANDPYRLVESTGNLGVIYYYKGEIALAYELLQRAGEMAAELNLLPLLARTCNNIGFVLTRMERLAEADAAFEESIRIKLQLGATAALVSPYNGRGRIALNLGRYHDASGFYRQALRWAEELNDRVNIGICRTNIGRCYLHTQQFEQAESYLSQAVACLSSTQFWNGIAMAYEQLAELCLTRGRPDDAFEYIEKCVDLARRHDNRLLEAAAWEQKARAYELADRKDEAMECMRKSFHLQQGRSGGDPWRPPRRSAVDPVDPSN